MSSRFNYTKREYNNGQSTQPELCFDKNVIIGSTLSASPKLVFSEYSDDISDEFRRNIDRIHIKMGSYNNGTLKNDAELYCNGQLQGWARIWFGGDVRLVAEQDITGDALNDVTFGMCNYSDDENNIITNTVRDSVTGKVKLVPVTYINVSSLIGSLTPYEETGSGSSSAVSGSLSERLAALKSGQPAAGDDAVGSGFFRRNRR